MKDGFVFPQDVPEKKYDVKIDSYYDSFRREGGLTKRELFAAMILSGAFSGGGAGAVSVDDMPAIAAGAVKSADILIAALGKPRA